MPRRLDYGQLSKPEKTPQGGFRIPAHLTRSGIFEYRRADGAIVREYRSPEEVFDAVSLATLRASAVTLRHPDEMIDTGNWRTHAVGHTGDEVRRDGDRIAADVIVQDADAIRAIERGVREISCGYNCDVLDEVGTTATGEAYDRRQTNIRYNHVAIVDRGRAGKDVRLRLDAEDNLVEDEVRNDQPGAPTMKEFEIIFGTRYEVGSEAHKDACRRRDEAEKARADELADLKRRADEAEAKLVDERKRADAAEARTKPEAIDRLVAARTAIVERAREVLGKQSKLEGKTDAEIRRLVIAKAMPEHKLDDEDDIAIAALFRALPALKARDAKRDDDDIDLRELEALQKVGTAVQDTSTGKLDGDFESDPEVIALQKKRKDAESARAEAWRRPLALSKDAG